VKKRILNFGVPATHELITGLGSFNDPVSISDFDAFIFDPLALKQGAVSHENYARRQAEIRDLIVEKGGIAISLLRQNHSVGVPYSGAQGGDTYGVFDPAGPNALAKVRGALRAGSGSRVEVLSSAKGASAGYFQVLAGALSFAAHLETGTANLEAVGGTVLAVNSVGYPIAVEFAVSGGRICFLPVPDGATGDRVGSAIVRIVEAHFGGPSEIEAPAWSLDLPIPGANAHDPKIAELEGRKEQIEAELVQLRQKRANLLSYRTLLYGQGKSVLEPVVRSAFRLLGFGVPDPEEYLGEWDFELHESRSSETAIGEIEGSAGVVDVDKYRQLLDYVQAEVLEGREHKGILVGNGFRLTAPDAPERQKQFSDHALRGAKRNGFCLVPTIELFKVVCAVLEATENEGLKIGIRDSILSTVGVWTFAREVGMTRESASAAPKTDASVAGGAV
jgi:hypothetical protein